MCQLDGMERHAEEAESCVRAGQVGQHEIVNKKSLSKYKKHFQQCSNQEPDPPCLGKADENINHPLTATDSSII